MARIVLGMGSSHTPMLNAPPTDWPRFIERDSRRKDLLDTEGRLTSYEAQLAHAPAGIAAEIAPERMRVRHAAVAGAMARLGGALRDAKLDALIVVGDDQDELYHHDNLPGILVYYGETIPNVPLAPVAEPNWGWRAAARWYEEKVPRDYPVDVRLARHLIGELIDREFDIATSDAVREGEGEGHAVGFVHKRIMQEIVPIVPVCINTYYPPNQPTPRRCYRLGQAIRAAVELLPGRHPGRHHRLGWAVAFRRRRGARPRLPRPARAQGRGSDRGVAARKAQFGQLGDPQLDLRRRRGRASVARMVALRAGLPHAGRHRHRTWLRILVVRGNVMRRKDSEDLVRVGPGTVMGGLMREYWMPAAMSSELEADGTPMRLMLLGRAADRVPRQFGAGRGHGPQMPAPLRLLVPRAQRGRRHPLRLSRLEIRHGGQLRRHAQPRRA